MMTLPSFCLFIFSFFLYVCLFVCLYVHIPPLTILMSMINFSQMGQIAAKVVWNVWVSYVTTVQCWRVWPWLQYRHGYRLLLSEKNSCCYLHPNRRPITFSRCIGNFFFLFLLALAWGETSIQLSSVSILVWWYKPYALNKASLINKQF